MIPIFLLLATLAITLQTPSTVIFANDDRIKYEGRFLVTNETAIFDWSCTTFSVTLAETSLTGAIYANMNGGGNKFIIRGCGASTMPNTL